MCIDFMRILRRRIFADSTRAFVLYIVFPIVVALVIAYAFILRLDECDHRDGLVFFSTLYAFWCGLFGTCQSINSEVATGEWCYWVLGCYRSRSKHLCAHIVVGIFLTFVQIFMSVVFLCFLCDWFCRLIGSQSTILVNLQNMYLREEVLFDGVWSVCLDFFEWTGSEWLGQMIVPTILLVSMLFAGLSGVGLGILFSCCLKEPLSSLNFSVVCIVVVAILSYTTLHNPNHMNHYIDKNGKDRRHFTPIYLLIKGYVGNMKKTIRLSGENKVESFKIHRLDLGDARALEWFSFILPQRYFYNIGRLTFNDKGYLCRPVLKQGGGYECDTFYCRCAKCLGVSESLGKWATNFYEGKAGNKFTPFIKIDSLGKRISNAWTMEEGLGFDDGCTKKERKILVRNFVTKNGGLIKGNYWGVRSFFCLFAKIALVEALVLVFQFGVCCLISLIIINRKRCYNLLR